MFQSAFTVNDASRLVGFASQVMLSIDHVMMMRDLPQKCQAKEKDEMFGSLLLS